jgi:cytochrome P450
MERHRSSHDVESSANKAENHIHNLFQETEKRPERRAHEEVEIPLAGSDTIARTMWIVVYHLLAKPAAALRLRRELEMVIPKPHDIID